MEDAPDVFSQLPGGLKPSRSSSRTSSPMIAQRWVLGAISACVHDPEHSDSKGSPVDSAWLRPEAAAAPFVVCIPSLKLQDCYQVRAYWRRHTSRPGRLSIMGLWVILLVACFPAFSNSLKQT